MSLAAALPATLPASHPALNRSVDSSIRSHGDVTPANEDSPPPAKKDLNPADSPFQIFLAGLLHGSMQKPTNLAILAAAPKVEAASASISGSAAPTLPETKTFFMGTATGGTEAAATSPGANAAPVTEPAATSVIKSADGLNEVTKTQISFFETAQTGLLTPNLANGKNEAGSTIPAQTPQIAATPRTRLPELTQNGLVSAKESLAVFEQANAGGNPSEAIITFQVPHITAEPRPAAGNTVDPGAHDAKATPAEKLPRQRDDQAPVQDFATQVGNAASDASTRINHPTATPSQPPGGQPASVSDQLAGSIIARAEVTTHNGRTDFHLRLEPPELGTVRVHITSTEHGVTARLVVHEEVARQLIESQLESLKQRLANAGIAFGSVNVSQEQGGSRNPQGRAQHDETAGIESGSSRSLARIGTARPLAAVAGPGSIDVVV
jgi:flagellar hook-length control protein FliK